MRKLTPREQIQLADALLSAFPTYGGLKRVVLLAFGESLESLAGQGPLRQVAETVAEQANARDKVQDLIVEGLTDNPGNPDLRAFAGQLLIALPATGSAERPAEATAEAEGK